MAIYTCPICDRQVTYGVDAHYPFCSRRCRDLDLMGWSEEKRTLSTEITDADEAMGELEDC
jgi:endogenous inhibitor of DNA gyrase (YacG/DUF329 family)